MRLAGWPMRKAWEPRVSRRGPPSGEDPDPNAPSRSRGYACGTALSHPLADEPLRQWWPAAGERDDGVKRATSEPHDEPSPQGFVKLGVKPSAEPAEGTPP